jgi:hypothetical protein
VHVQLFEQDGNRAEAAVLVVEATLKIGILKLQTQTRASGLEEAETEVRRRRLRRRVGKRKMWRRGMRVRGVC